MYLILKSYCAFSFIQLRCVMSVADFSVYAAPETHEHAQRNNEIYALVQLTVNGTNLLNFSGTSLLLSLRVWVRILLKSLARSEFY